LKSFYAKISIRLILVAIAIFLSSYYFLKDEITWLVVSVIFAIYFLFSLIRFIDNTNREVTDFIRGINYSDFTQNVRIGKLGGIFVELAEEMDKLIAKFKTTRFEKEENFRYLQTIVEHVAIGLIAFDSRGDIQMLNKTAKKLFKISHLNNITKLEQNGFGKFLFQMSPEHRSTFKLMNHGESLQLMIHSTEFRIKDENLKLISLYNIQPELEATEIEAWQKLIRVLTHEIMNSITPISSLAATTSGLIKNSESEPLSKETLNDIERALHTIQKRSDGLSVFVNKFRDISKIPKPNFTNVKVEELFYRVRLLSEKSLSTSNISLSTSINPEDLEIIIDPDLFEQVLINLINNSTQALNNSSIGKIELSAEINEQGKAIIKVTDNGSGISEDTIDKVFVPFFTTKKDGSGIGLSISQSIIRAHSGTIWVQSTPERGTTFTIRL
jgi:two-component system, NtrC family, nitrogen regulation sensor histidine kinase NtrY